MVRIPKSSGAKILVRTGLISTGTNCAMAVPVIMVVTFFTNSEFFSLLASSLVVAETLLMSCPIIWFAFLAKAYNAELILFITW
jgi:hypothetical protein